MTFITPGRRHSYDGILTKHDDPLEFTKAAGDSGTITGYASVAWEVDSYLECAAPGAFEQTIAERGPKGADRILFRFEHEHTCGKHTEMSETPTGLRIEAQIVDDGMWGTALRRHLQAGVPYGLSIGFRRVSARPATDRDPLDWSRVPKEFADRLDPSDVTVLTAVKLLENSAVSFPAVDSALIDSYRSDMETLTQRHIDALLRDHKTGRLTVEHRRALAQVLPAASGPGPEKGTPVAARTTGRRNYYAEAILADAELQLAEAELDLADRIRVPNSGRRNYLAELRIALAGTGIDV